MSEPVLSPNASPWNEQQALQDVLGYLNFSNGKPDARFQSNLNHLHTLLSPQGDVVPLRGVLSDRLAELRKTSPVFRESSQAEAVISLVFDGVIPAYRRFHADLLYHLEPADFYQAFFVARAAEAVLSQGGPWHETERIVAGALARLNDFIGHRPVAVLENGRQMQPYEHERFRPIPLFLRGAGTAFGRHRELIGAALELLGRTPADVLRQAYFDLDHLDELSLDVRAYDQGHPVYKRTNYTFGEWDPHTVDLKGNYSRFVVRAIILDALHDWMKSTDLPQAEKIYEAGAVLAGTMLMASSVSGSGPDTHDSNVSLTSLLPKIARQRDAFYTRLLESMKGRHAERLKREAQAVQQPFGGIRQHLNLFMAHYACRQMQRAQLAYLYARMGYPEAAREQATVIPSAAARFETEIQWRITLAHQRLDNGEVQPAAQLGTEMQNLLHRGIECGALVDPWNILGFQGNFPLFMAREDSLPDPRVERLIALMEQMFNLYSRLLCEAAALGDRSSCDAIGAEFRTLAEFWDRFATTTVSDLPAVQGMESHDAAAGAIEALWEWHRGGESVGDIAFWKRYVDRFRSSQTFAILVEILLDKGDLTAAMNLLMQWLSLNDTVPLETGRYSFNLQVQRWLGLALQEKAELRPALVRRFLDLLEVNCGEMGQVPGLVQSPQGGLSLGESAQQRPPRRDDGGDFDAEFSGIEPDDALDEDDEESLFSAAYENVVFRDSAQDGTAGDTLDSGPVRSDSDLDLLSPQLEQRMRFLATWSSLWRTAVESLAAPESAAGGQPKPGKQQTYLLPDELREPARHWKAQNRELIDGLSHLMREIAAWEPAAPEADPDSFVEYDRQLHLKFNLLNGVISTCAVCHETARLFECALDGAAQKAGRPGSSARMIEVFRLLSLGQIDGVRRALPALLRDMSKKPLLYVPLDRGGDPRDVLAARNLHGALHALLQQLPRYGLFRETWHVLRIAYVMERTAPPTGMSITEFDHLLETALRASLEALVVCARHWKGAGDQKLVEGISRLVEVYLRLWLKHSATMRLSSVELLKEAASWKEVRGFIRTYGGDLFHPRVLTMGNLRGILQRGADAYLDYLIDNEDPLHPVKLLEDLDTKISREDAVECLELILRCIVEKFERFIEYNTTTTQSDYGERLDALLDFLRLETEYERHAWNLFPFELAHQVLARTGHTRAAETWEKVLKSRTSSIARELLQKLKRLEKKHGLRLPGITDRLNERFVKPLVLDRILALVRPAVRAASQPGEKAHFEQLRVEIEAYLDSSSGSALELQPWLQSLVDEVETAVSERGSDAPALDESATVEISVTWAQLEKQLDDWEKPLE
jgi:hypothetical protein